MVYAQITIIQAMQRRETEIMINLLIFIIMGLFIAAAFTFC